MKMNFHDWEDYRLCLKSARDERLHSLRKWLETRPNERERDTKILYIDLEIERREKLRRYYENFS